MVGGLPREVKPGEGASILSQGAPGIEKLVKAAAPAIRIAEVRSKRRSAERYRLLLFLVTSALASENPLRAVTHLSNLVVMASELGVELDDNVVRVARSTAEAGLKLEAAAAFAGGYGTRESRVEGRVGRVYYVDGSVVYAYADIAGEREAEYLLQHIQLLPGNRVVTAEVEGEERIIGLELTDVGFSLLVQSFVSKTMPLLMKAVSEIVSYVTEGIDILLPTLEAISESLRSRTTKRYMEALSRLSEKYVTP